MNIFFIDRDVERAARANVNAHVSKMVLEYAQIMSTVHHLSGSKLASKVYKPTHTGNRFVLWTMETAGNYSWLYLMWDALHQEFEYRFKKPHKSFTNLNKYLDNIPRIPDRPMTTPQIPDDIDPDWIVRGNVQETYRNIYRYGKIHLHKWTGRRPPAWIKT